MKLLAGEKIIKVYHHHGIFFLLRLAKIWAASLPFFFVAYIFAPLFAWYVQANIYLGIVGIFCAVSAYDMLIYYLDTLVLTNKRVVHLDWINPFKYVEIEAMLDDIQNIESRESGFLSQFPIFDFGTFVLETASTKMVLDFPQAPDPEGIKFFIYSISKKHNNQGLKAKITDDQIDKLDRQMNKQGDVDLLTADVNRVYAGEKTYPNPESDNTLKN